MATYSLAKCSVTVLVHAADNGCYASIKACGLTYFTNGGSTGRTPIVVYTPNSRYGFNYDKSSTTVTVTAYAGEGFEFVRWSSDGTESDSLSTQNPWSKTVSLTKTSTVDRAIYAHAVFKEKTYTITFDANNGKAVSDIAKKHNSSINLPSTTRNGYTLSHWADKDGNNVGKAGSAYTQNGDATLYAVWTPNVHTLSIKKGSGIATIYYKINGSSSYTSSATSADVKVNYGSTWYVYATAIEGYTSLTSSSNPASSTVAGDASFSATATANTYYVRFNANGGTGTMANESFVYDTAKALTANSFARTHYRFSGWSTSASGSVAYADKASVKNLTKTADGTVNLYAVWTRNKATITFNANGGGTAPNPISVNSGESGVLPSMSRGGFLFGGWATVKSSTTATYAKGESYYPGTLTADKSVTLYAVWKSRYVCLGYDNLFLYSDWMYSESAKIVNNGNKQERIQFGDSELRLIYGKGESATSTDTIVYTRGELYGDGYYVNVSGSAEYRMSARLRETARSYGVCLTFYSSSGTKVGSTIEKNWSTGSNDSTYVNFLFTTPSTASKMCIRFHIRSEGTSGCFALVKVQETPAFVSDGMSHMPYTYAEGKTYRQLGRSLSSPTRTGYAFGGWYFNKSFSGNAISLDDVASDVSRTIYSKWTPNTYYIDYADAGGRAPTVCTYDSVVSIPAPTKPHYRFKGWKVSGAQFSSSTAKWGTSSNPASDVSTSTLMANGVSGNVYVKNLATASNGRVTLTAQWERITYSVTLDNSGIGHWSVSASSEDDAEFNGAFAKIGGTAVFTVKAGCTYSLLSRMVVNSSNASAGTNGSYPIPKSYSYCGTVVNVNRVGDENGFPGFMSSFEVPDNMDHSLGWKVSGVQRCYAKSLAPSGVTYSPGVMTIGMKPGVTTRTFVVTANKSAAMEFDRWSKIGPATSGSSSTDSIELENGFSDISVEAMYKLRRVDVGGNVHPASSAITGHGATVTVKSGGTACTDVAYGGSVEWKCSTSNNDYQFAGWYSEDGKLKSTDNPLTDAVTEATNLYAKLNAEVTLSTLISGDGVMGSVGIAVTPTSPVSYESGTITRRVIVGDEYRIVAYPNELGHFGGWYIPNAQGQRGERKPFVADQTIVMGSKASYIAFISDVRDLFYIALYNSVPATSPREYVGVEVGTMSASSSVEEEFKEIEPEEYSELSGLSPKSTSNAKFYEVNGINRITLSSQKASGGDKSLLRIVAAKPLSSITSVLSSDSTTSVVVNANMDYFAEWGDAEKRTLTVSCNVDNLPGGELNRDCGSVELSADATSYSPYSGGVASGTYEKHMEYRAYAIPKNGYAFGGWYADSECTELLSAESSYSAEIEDDVTIYAKFRRANASLYLWEGSGDNKIVRWRSKVYELSKPSNMTSVRVDANEYPIESFSVVSYSSPEKSRNAERDVSLYEVNTRIDSQTMRRLPSRRPERYFQVEIVSDAEVDAITLGTSGGGLAT